MSIFQDFERIRNDIGHEKYDMIEKYLEIVSPNKNVDKYFKEMNNIWKYPPNEWNKRSNELKQRYGVILLDDILHKREQWNKYENWYNENYLGRNIKILNMWPTDYDDIRCNAILYQDGKEVANVIASYDESDLRYSISDKDSEMNNEFVSNAFKSLIYHSFDLYLNLPKISECSKLLQSIYDNVCNSDATMCHITEDDWKEYYTDDYSEKDIEVLKEEIKKYELNEVIGINDGEYKIIGYGDLETRFNDDRSFEKIKDSEIEI